MTHPCTAGRGGSGHAPARPVISGEADLGYLRHALARAGRPFAATHIAANPLTDGRTGSAVTRLETSNRDGEVRRFVLKAVRSAPWRDVLGMGGTEARLWLSGATRTLPAGLYCPTVDVARHASRAQWWILMEDVSTGILPRGAFDQTRARSLMRRIAHLHARYWGREEELEALPVTSFDKSANGLARLSAHVARGDTASEPWLDQLSEDFWVPRVMMPTFLGALTTQDADFYVELCRDHARIASALGSFPQTLCHGDLRRANIAFLGDDVVLFDWEFAARGPAVRDLQWYWFLQFWAYPPDDGRALEDREGLLDVYLDTLEREHGIQLSRALFDESCQLAWLSTFCQIGCCLADPLTGASPSAEAVARARRVIGEAIHRARRIHERHVR